MSFVTNYNVGGVVDEVKKIKLVQGVDTVGFVGGIQGFPRYTQPYNTMGALDVPPHTLVASQPYQVHEIRYTSPPQDVELVSFVVTCSGYGEDDYYDLYVNGNVWFKHWFPSEVKEGLYIGQSTIVYQAPPNTEIVLRFHNVSNTSKRVWLGIRMLVETPIPDTYDNVTTVIDATTP